MIMPLVSCDEDVNTPRTGAALAAARRERFDCAIYRTSGWSQLLEDSRIKVPMPLDSLFHKYDHVAA